MSQDNKEIILSGGLTHVTSSPQDAYRVTEGVVLVYIAPLVDGKPARRSFFYKAAQGEIIPSFCYKDIEDVEWRFCFVSEKAARLDVIENGSTSILREKFAKKADIKNYDVEGFDGGLVDKYKINIVAEDSFIIKSRRDREQTAKNIINLIKSSMEAQGAASEDDTGKPLYDCVSRLCRKTAISIAPYERIKSACTAEPQLADIARVSHFSFRKVILEENWYKKDFGAMLAFLADGKTPVALLPKGAHSYEAWNPKTGESKTVHARNCADYDVIAYVLCRPLPSKKLGVRDVLGFFKGSLRARDVALFSFLSIILALTGILLPIISQKLYDEYIPLGAQSVLVQLGGLMTSFLVANLLFSIVKNLSQYRIAHKVSYDFQNALYDRLFNLSESFFKDFESADLAQAVMSASGIASTVIAQACVAGAAIISFVEFLVRMGLYSGTLTCIGILASALYLAAYCFINNLSLKYDNSIADLEGSTSSKMYQFVNGISKIRIAGAEESAIYEFMKSYSRLRINKESAGRIISIGSVLSLIASNVFLVVFYILVVKSELDVSIGEFLAFNTTFGYFFSAFAQLANAALDLRRLKPAIRRLKPVITECPEYDDTKELPTNISGKIELSNVCFSYSESQAAVINGISLDIKAGEYIGIVGSSGCGKSTLLKILLGFERPQSGKVYYDSNDIDSLDKRELRKKLGVVLQDGKLISGSIFENISITAPWATKADVEEVIQSVGLTEDIQKMPMGLNTVLSESCDTISGGQRQRILIARALISKPKILFFDEATSALDNITQQTVCDTLEKIPATRLVIAHRLSTVKNCDRIIVMDKGKIAEQGSYSELMDKKGLFWQFAERQMV